LSVERKGLVLKYDKRGLIDELKGFAKVFIVKPDMTYHVKTRDELNLDTDLGLMGFAFKSGKGIAWLKDEDGFRVVQMNVERFYCHPSLAPRGWKLEEVI